MAVIPSEEKRKALLEEHDVPDNVRAHMRMVAKVAGFLAMQLKKKGIDVDSDLVEAAALLHDIAKIKGLDKELGFHELLGKDILEKEGFPNVASLIEKHGFEAVLEDNLNSWEEKILNYADKRVLEDKVVSLDERFAYGRRRYPDKSGRREIGEAKIRRLEKEICSAINVDPDDLKEAVQHE